MGFDKSTTPLRAPYPLRLLYSFGSNVLLCNEADVFLQLAEACCSLVSHSQRRDRLSSVLARCHSYVCCRRAQLNVVYSCFPRQTRRFRMLNAVLTYYTHKTQRDNSIFEQKQWTPPRKTLHTKCVRVFALMEITAAILCAVYFRQKCLPEQDSRALIRK